MGSSSASRGKTLPMSRKKSSDLSRFSKHRAQNNRLLPSQDTTEVPCKLSSSSTSSTTLRLFRRQYVANNGSKRARHAGAPSHDPKALSLDGLPPDAQATIREADNAPADMYPSSAPGSYDAFRRSKPLWTQKREIRFPTDHVDPEDLDLWLEHERQLFDEYYEPEPCEQEIEIRWNDGYADDHPFSPERLLHQAALDAVRSKFIIKQPPGHYWHDAYGDSQDDPEAKADTIRALQWWWEFDVEDLERVMQEEEELDEHYQHELFEAWDVGEESEDPELVEMYAQLDPEEEEIQRQIQNWKDTRWDYY